MFQIPTQMIQIYLGHLLTAVAGRQILPYPLLACKRSNSSGMQSNRPSSLPQAILVNSGAAVKAVTNAFWRRKVFFSMQAMSIPSTFSLWNFRTGKQN
jgi:hypothetical protein